MLRLRARSRISISHKHGALIIQIPRNPNCTGDLVGLFIGLGFAFLCFFMFCPEVARIKSALEFLLLLAVFAPFALGSLWLLSKFYLGAFGAEEVSVSGDTLVWNRKAPAWSYKFEASLSSISQVIAKTPWDGKNNCVEIISNGKRLEIGDRLLPDEAIEIARELQAALRR